MVSSTSPVEDSHTAAVSTNIAATFDANLSAPSVTDQTFVVQGAQSSRFLTANGDIMSFTASGATITLDPANDYHPDERVRVTATAGIQDAGLLR